jgi:Dolichyl-phosphate-mannose-protein mannosyltransferase
VQSSLDRRWLGVLLAVLLVVYVIQINHGLPNRDIVWGYDANPLVPLIAFKKIFLDGWNTGWHTAYPNFHYYLLLLLLAPYMATQWMLGNLSGLRMEGGYPYGLQDFDTIFMHLAIITRFVSAAMAVGTAYWVYQIGRALRSTRAGLFAACIIGFSPAIVYYVHVETLDMPMLFWLSAALYCYVRALQTLELRFFVWLAILAAIATATKDYAYGLFVLLPLPLVAGLARRSYGSVSLATLLRSAFDRRPMMALVAFAISFIVAENWWWNFSGFINHVRLAGGFVPDSEITTSFGRLDFFSGQRWRDMGQCITFVLGWAGVVVAMVGLIYAVLRERTIAAILLWPALSYYVFTICQVLPAGVPIERPYLPLGMILAIMGGVFLARASASRLVVPKVLTASAIIAIAANGIAMDLALIADPRYQAEQWLVQNVAGGAKVEFYGLRSQLPRANRQWLAITLNQLPLPSSDLPVTRENLSPEALAARNPEWVVVSDVYADGYSSREDAKTDSALPAFFRRLRNGELGYAEKRRFSSAISQVLGFPDRLTPGITVYSPQRKS